MDIHILAIESSCDDTSAAVLRNDKVLANLVAGQKVHEKYGGIVPELASRAHMQHIVPVVDQALQQAGVDKQQLNAIGFTRGPGLIGSLLVGGSFAKAMALGLNIPLIEVNHMQAHVLSHFIEEPKPDFPFICLTVSGGHTQIVLVKDFLEMEVIGETIDDAAGEAFDKSAKMLGLPYPGGPLIDKYARGGNPFAFSFAEPKVDGLNFSFSGFKTSVLYFLQKQPTGFIEDNMKDLCASIQYVIVDILIKKLVQASEKYGIREIAIAGGVSANSGLRKQFQDTGRELNWNIYIPKFEFCTDNAGMIGITAYYKYLRKEFAGQAISVAARYKL